MESPRTIDKYELVEKLGEGGFGVVYKARHLVTKLPVAIKILVTRTDAHPDVAKRFRREASIGNEIDHENIVRALDFGDVAGQPYLVLEFLDGVGVDEAVRTHGPMASHRVARIALQVADALAAAHGHGVIHRDLKPENIFLVRRSGRDDFVKVLDFGIAKLTAGASLDGLATRSQMLIGSPVTMSPEQCRGADIDSRSDVYALGIVIFFALTGRYPFFGAQADILSMHLRDTPPRVDAVRPGVPEALSRLVARALAKEPAARFQTMGDLARALAPLTSDPALAATPQERPTTIEARRARWPAMVAVAAAGAAVALAGAGAWLRARTPAATEVGELAASGVMTSETRAGGGEVAATAVGATTRSSPPAQREGTVGLRAAGAAAARPDGPTAARATRAVAAREDERAPTAAARGSDAAARASGGVALRGEEPSAARASGGVALRGEEPSAARANGEAAARAGESSTGERNGYLSVAVLPFAEVLVDGHVAGTTPLRNLPLRPGAHTVEISNTGLRRHTCRTERIDAGAHRRIQLDWSN